MVSMSVLAAMSNLEIAVMVCVIALAVALVVVCALIIVYSGKIKNKAHSYTVHPIIITRTVRVKDGAAKMPEVKVAGGNTADPSDADAD